MLKKVLKHEFRAFSRIMLPIFLAALGVAILSPVLMSVLRPYVEKNDIFLTFYILIFGLTFLLLGASVLSVPVVTAVRFYRGMFSDEGYLTLSMPVNTHTQIIGRLLVSLCYALIMVVLAAAAIGACILMVDYALGDALADIFEFGDAFEELGITFSDSELLLTAILGFLTIPAAAVCTVLSLYAAIAVGNSFTGSKVGLSIVFIFVFRIGWSILENAAGAITNAIVWANAPDPIGGGIPVLTQKSEMSLMSVNLALTLGLCVLFYWLTYHFSTKKLNLQ